MRTLVCFLFLLAVLLTAAEEEYDNSCECSTIRCVCGIGENKTFADVEVLATEYKTTGEVTCGRLPDPLQICSSINCTLAQDISPNTDSSLSSSFSDFPQVIESDGPASYQSHRFSRQSDPCHIPRFESAKYKCWAWPNWVTCEISCIRNNGMTYEDGTASVATFSCRYTENEWKPHKPQDCKPYYNCKVKLISPGSVHCHEPLDSDAYCDISCDYYGDYDRIAEKRYTCVDEKFQDSLPHCVALDPNATTIERFDSDTQ